MSGFKIFRLFFICASIGVTVSRLAHAETYVLYTKQGKQVAGYDDIIKKAGAGDVLDMGDGRTFRITRRINHGNACMIFETDTKRALRVPLARGDAVIVRSGGKVWKLATSYLQALTDWYSTGMKLMDSEVPVPKIFAEESNPRRYISEELVDKKFSLSRFSQVSRAELGLSDAEYLRIRSALVDFAGKTWQFSKISDLHLGQIVWDGQKWILLDFGSTAARAKSEAATTIFDHLFYSEILDNPLNTALKRAALTARQSHLASCASLFSTIGK